jgi:acyl carrier protein
MRMSEAAVFQTVKETLVAVLSVSDDDVVPGAKITADLGAESIDFLDIVFRLEKTLGIKIPPGELFPDNVFNNPKFIQNGKLTPAGLGHLKQSLPHLDYTEFEKNPDVSQIAGLFTVGAITSYIFKKVNEGGRA